MTLHNNSRLYTSPHCCSPTLNMIHCITEQNRASQYRTFQFSPTRPTTPLNMVNMIYILFSLLIDIIYIAFLIPSNHLFTILYNSCRIKYDTLHFNRFQFRSGHHSSCLIRSFEYDIACVFILA